MAMPVMPGMQCRIDGTKYYTIYVYNKKKALR